MDRSVSHAIVGIFFQVNCAGKFCGEWEVRGRGQKAGSKHISPGNQFHYSKFIPPFCT